MKCHKGLLVPWLRNALNKNLYQALRWENEDLGIFSIMWTHKSAEQWTIDVLEPFEAWAEFKGKLTNKNPKTLKATFRCALNSKKDELKELKRQKNRRLWQFIDPKIDQGKLENKKGPKPNSKRMTVEPNNRVSCALFNSSVDFSKEDVFKPSEEKIPKRRKRRTECKPIDNISQSMKIESVSDVENQLPSCLSPVQTKTQKQSRTDKLPPFQSICNFQPLTPPYQDNEIFFSSTECSIGINSPDTSRLTPPLDVPPKSHSISSLSSPYHQQLSSDVWQPNCWSISSTQQSFSIMNPFSSDLYEFGETAIQKPRGDKVDSAEMDQFVPVMNMDNQVPYPDEPFSSPYKPVPQNNQMSEQMELEDLLFSISDSEACEKIIQELNSYDGGFSYNS